MIDHIPNFTSGFKADILKAGYPVHTYLKKILTNRERAHQGHVDQESQTKCVQK